VSALARLYEEIANCHQCELAKHRNRVVPGEGPEDANIVFVGEAPAGMKINKGALLLVPLDSSWKSCLPSIGLKREQVYICNVIKCRPPENRDPLR